MAFTPPRFPSYSMGTAEAVYYDSIVGADSHGGYNQYHDIYVIPVSGSYSVIRKGERDSHIFKVFNAGDIVLRPVFVGRITGK